MSSEGICTRAIHGGLTPDPATGAILTPIYQSTTYVQQAVGVHKGFTYSRAQNPTVDALERSHGLNDFAKIAGGHASYRQILLPCSRVQSKVRSGTSVQIVDEDSSPS